MMWNVARYLRDLANRPGDIEGFVHDGLALHKPFRPSFKWFEDVITEIVTQDPEFKLLTFGLHNSWLNQLKRIDPITPTSLHFTWYPLMGQLWTHLFTPWGSVGLRQNADADVECPIQFCDHQARR